MLKQLNDTINYIEEHLLDEKVIDEAMKRVSVSELHFKNVFFFLTGMAINRWMGLHEHLKTGVVSYPPRFQGEGNIKCFPNLIS